MTTIKAILTSAAVLGVAACGGNTVPVMDNPDPDPLSFREIAGIAGDINDGYNAVVITPKNLVPARGGATYSGAVGGDLQVGRRITDVAGLMELDVDFTSDRVGGLVGNLVTRDGDKIDGNLSLRNGELNRRSNSQQVAIFADVDGNLRSAAGERIEVDARLRNSGFKGRDVRFVGGDIDGDIWVDGQRGAIDLDLQLEHDARR